MLLSSIVHHNVPQLPGCHCQKVAVILPSKEPVTACPASVSYKLQKYIRRYRAGVAVAFLLALIIIAFGIVEAVQLRRTTRDRDRANRMTKFMTGVYRVSNPGSRITAQEILDNAAKKVRTELANDPELQAQMMDVMGTLYYGLGLYPQAESLLSRALGIRRAVLGPEHLQTVQLMHSLANALTKEGCPKAEKLYRETLAIRLRINGPDHPDTLNSLDTLGDTLDYEDRYSEAEQLERESLNIQRRDLGPEHPDTLKEASRRQKNFLRGLESS